MGAKQKILLSLAILLLLALCVFIIYGDNGLMEYRYLKLERDKLAAKNEAILQGNLELYRKVERLQKDITYIESVARKELGVIGKDEIIIKLEK